MYTIQANPSGTRSIEVSTENLRTIEKYSLFRHLIDSTGIVDEPVLDKLKLNVRSLIASQEEDSKDLLDLCIDVIYHNNMKAFGLQQLIKLYLTWLSSPEAEEEEEIPEIRPVEREHEKSTKKAEDAVLLQDVLTEYFS